MKKTNYISRTVYHVLMVLPLLALTLLTACSEDETTFPDYEKDWFQLEDSSDPAQHAAYEFFKQYGIPIFFNDTIGTQQRVDVFGNEYTFYKTLTLNAAIGGGQSSYGDAFYNTFTYADRSVIPDAIQYLRTQLMPTIPNFLHIHSILLVEAINGSSDDVYVGLNTLVITKASLLASYQADQTKKLRAVVLRSFIGKKLTGDINYEEGLKRFYSVSRAIYDAHDVYNYSTWYFNANNMPGCPFDPYDWSVQAKDKMLWAGFLDAALPYFNSSPTEQADVNMFTEAYFTYTDEEFQNMYGAYPRVMEKWSIIKPMLDDIMKQ